ncbi:major facilitator superfamily domain-containing protein [Aspergillus falconensis]
MTAASTESHTGTVKEATASTPSYPKEDDPHDDRLYKPKTLKFWLVIACNLLALFIVALDRTIITTALPQITNEFHRLGDIGWYVSAYMLTSAVGQLMYGRLYKFYNMKVTFLASIIVFEAGSALCGAAPNSGSFIAGRAIAGFAGAGIFSGCMLVIIPMVPLHIRPKFQGLFGMIFGVASVLGPLIGGGFTKTISWRQREAVSPFTHFKRLDPLGMLFFIPAMACLMLALQWGGSKYAWGNGRIIVLLVVFSVLLVAYGAVQAWLPDTATIPPKVVMQRSIFCAALYTFCVSGGMILLIYYIPEWFQTVKGFSSTQSGVDMFPLMLSMIVSTFVGGITTQQIGYYVPAMLFCPIIMATGLGLLSTWSIDTGNSSWVGYQFLSGFGLGFGLQISGLVVQRILPADDIPLGVALLFFLQQLGGSVFSTVAENMLTNMLIARLVGVVPGLDSSKIINGGATDLVRTAPDTDKITVRLGYNYSITRIFLAAMGVTLGGLVSALGMEWLNIKKPEDGQNDPEASGRGEKEQAKSAEEVVA